MADEPAVIVEGAASVTATPSVESVQAVEAAATERTEIVEEAQTERAQIAADRDVAIAERVAGTGEQIEAVEGDVSSLNQRVQHIEQSQQTMATQLSSMEEATRNGFAALADLIKPLIPPPPSEVVAEVVTPEQAMVQSAEDQSRVTSERPKLRRRLI